MMKVRIATADDVSRILEIAKDAISPAWTEKSVQGELDRGDSLVLVAVSAVADALAATHTPDNRTVPASLAVEEQLAGFAAFREVGGDGEVLQIAVDAKARRGGVGGALMGAILDHAAAKGLGSIFLEVRVSNVAAVSFYKKHGFEQVRIRRDYYSDPVEDAIVMARI